MYETTGGDGGADGGFALAASEPAAGATDVKLGVTVILSFSHFPDPATIVFPAITIRSGGTSFSYAASVDLVAKSAILQKSSAFSAGAQYEVVVSTDVRSLAGVAAQPVIVTFTTGSSAGGGITPPTPRTLAGDVQ